MLHRFDLSASLSHRPRRVPASSLSLPRDASPRTQHPAQCHPMYSQSPITPKACSRAEMSARLATAPSALVVRFSAKSNIPYANVGRTSKGRGFGISRFNSASLQSLSTSSSSHVTSCTPYFLHPNILHTNILHANILHPNHRRHQHRRHQLPPHQLPPHQTSSTLFNLQDCCLRDTILKVRSLR